MSVKKTRLENTRPQSTTFFAHAEAEPLFKRALAIEEKALGPEHPDVATTLKSYAALLRKTGRSTAAQGMEARAKAIRAETTTSTEAPKLGSPPTKEDEISRQELWDELERLTPHFLARWRAIRKNGEALGPPANGKIIAPQDLHFSQRFSGTSAF